MELSTEINVNAGPSGRPPRRTSQHRAAARRLHIVPRVSVNASVTMLSFGPSVFRAPIFPEFHVAATDHSFLLGCVLTGGHSQRTCSLDSQSATARQGRVNVSVAKYC